ALDGKGPNSPYAQSLAEHLGTPNLDVRLIFGAVRDEVVKLTDGKQEPYVDGSLGGDEIFLSRSEASGDSGNLSKANSRYASADTTNVSSVASLPPHYVAGKDALTADSWESQENYEPAYPGSLYAA